MLVDIRFLADRWFLEPNAEAVGRRRRIANAATETVRKVVTDFTGTSTAVQVGTTWILTMGSTYDGLACSEIQADILLPSAAAVAAWGHELCETLRNSLIGLGEPGLEKGGIVVRAILASS